jgi:hypothetical protein
MGTGNVYAQTAVPNNLCRNVWVIFGFFNGVLTTQEKAENLKQRLERIYGGATRAREQIRYELMYNDSKGFDDFVETFEQRLLEQDGLLEGRFELFFEAINGSGLWWETIIRTVVSARIVLDSFVNWVRATGIEKLTALMGTPQTLATYAEHRTRVDNWVLEGKKMLFFAHSQGNLFANAAYEYALTKTTVGSVKVVHVAPASATLKGPHTLANLDLVINALSGVGGSVSVTDNIPGYQQRPAGENGERHILGHGLVEIYLNPSLATSTRIKNDVNAALGLLVAPPARATCGFFTATLT